MSDAMRLSSDHQRPDKSKPDQGPAYKAAKLAVIILSGLIILALVALVVGAVTKLGGKTDSAASSQVFALPPGARIVSMDSQPGRLILRVRDAAGEEIDILDTANGHLVGQVKTTSAQER
jgi:hypothetical protein